MFECDLALTRTTRAGTQRTMTMLLDGEIDRSAFEAIAQMLFDLAQRGVSNVVIDFSQVSHIDYRLVKALAARAEAFRSAGGDIKLSGLSPYLVAIFQSVGAHDDFEFYLAQDDAEAAFAFSGSRVAHT